MSDRWDWLDTLELSPPDEFDRIVVSAGGRPILRLAGDAALVLAAAQRVNPRTIDAVTSSLGGRVAVEAATALLDAVGSDPAVVRSLERRPRRLQVEGPTAIRLTVVDPMRLLARAFPLHRLARSRATWGALAVLTVIGMAGTGVLVLDPTSALHRPMDPYAYLGIAVLFTVVVILHELAHALALIAHGGASRRVGVMLFYFAPAFFCDVSDSWHLSRPERVIVALAGTLVQGAIGAALTLAALLGAPFAPLLAAVGLLCSVYVFANLLPFVKLDGYVALVGWLDHPNLRAHALVAVRRWATHVVAPSAPPVLPGSRGLVAFGAACAVTPVVLVTAVVSGLWSNVGHLQLGAIALLVIGALLLAWVVVRVIRLARHLVRVGAAPARVLPAALVVAGIAAAVLTVPIATSVRGGYTAEPSPSFVALGPVVAEPGSRVTVFAPGLLPGARLGDGVIAGGPEPCTVPVESIAPVDLPGVPVDAECWPVEVNLAGVTRGVAILETPPTSILDRIGALVDTALARTVHADPATPNPSALPPREPDKRETSRG
ncbi:hypothetical protein MN032_08235 [Agromyces atrinae]|uniref:hypothetical protein n=1 Tax=Agromyces atrinae TaxID=592376 RepID=UPI001F5999C3|nr:hypothetical protein [Agromyces atrinae]MCI2957678.1 hypothetical protein [Agromyces atrinae]